MNKNIFLTSLRILSCNKLGIREYNPRYNPDAEIIGQLILEKVMLYGKGKINTCFWKCRKKNIKTFPFAEKNAFGL